MRYRMFGHTSSVDCQAYTHLVQSARILNSIFDKSFGFPHTVSKIHTYYIQIFNVWCSRPLLKAIYAYKYM